MPPDGLPSLVNPGFARQAEAEEEKRFDLSSASLPPPPASRPHPGSFTSLSTTNTSAWSWTSMREAVEVRESGAQERFLLAGSRRHALPTSSTQAPKVTASSSSTYSTYSGLTDPTMHSLRSAATFPRPSPSLSSSSHRPSLPSLSSVFPPDIPAPRLYPIQHFAAPPPAHPALPSISSSSRSTAAGSSSYHTSPSDRPANSRRADQVIASREGLFVVPASSSFSSASSSTPRAPASAATRSPTATGMRVRYSLLRDFLADERNTEELGEGDEVKRLAREVQRAERERELQRGEGDPPAVSTGNPVADLLLNASSARPSPSSTAQPYRRFAPSSMEWRPAHQGEDERYQSMFPPTT